MVSSLSTLSASGIKCCMLKTYYFPSALPPFITFSLIFIKNLLLPGIHLILLLIWRWSKEFGRKNVIRVLPGEGIVCVSDTWFKREGKRKVTFRMGENET